MVLKSRSPSPNGAPRRSERVAQRPAYPFTAIVGQDEMKLALLLNAIYPAIGGVLIMGHRGTGKSTAVRALADLLPPILRVRDCLYGCDPQDQPGLCADCRERLHSGGKLVRQRAVVPVVDLPLGATEDRICGTINLERALTEGVKVFEPGLLARANRGFLYIDEVNLLEDHLIDLLLDAAVTGHSSVEREGISIEHPARFVLIGSGNPEEGELRPQLLDRFGLHVEVGTEVDLDRRVQIVLAREAFELDPAAFLAGQDAEQSQLRRRLDRAREGLHQVSVPRELLRRIAGLCSELKIDGHRGELTITRAACALAALEDRRQANESDVRRVGVMALRHRLRRDPLEQTTGGARIEQALDQLFPPAQSGLRSPGDQGGEGEKESSPPRSQGDGAKGKASAQGRSNKALSEQGAQGGNEQGKDEQVRAPKATEATLPDVGPTNKRTRAETRTKKDSHHTAGRQRELGRSTYNTLRGRYTLAVTAKTDGARIALDATLRAVAERKAEAGGREPGERKEGLSKKVQLSAKSAHHVTRIEERTGSRNAIRSSAHMTDPEPLTPALPDLRYKRFKRKAGTLFIFAIDTSGSMALNRIGQAKGALAGLLRQSYIRRDRVALISFRGKQAEVLLPPSGSVTRAGRILEELCLGGPTPLAAGIFSALEIAKRARAMQGPRRVVLLLFTDGHANVSLRGETARAQLIWRELEQLGTELRGADISTIVVDTQNRFTSGGEGERLADKLGGRHLFLSPGATAKEELDRLSATGC